MILADLSDEVVATDSKFSKLSSLRVKKSMPLLDYPLGQSSLEMKIETMLRKLGKSPIVEEPKLSTPYDDDLYSSTDDSLRIPF